MYDGRAVSLAGDWVLMCAEQLGSLIFWGVVTIVLAIFFTIASLRHSLSLPPRYFPDAFFISVLLGVFRAVKEYLMENIGLWRRVVSPTQRIELDSSIKRLEAKLAAREERG